MIDPLRAAVEPLANVQPGQLIDPKASTTRQLASAILSVLEGCDLAEDPDSSVWVCPENVRQWIADALGIEL
jgi:hypothetical protein